MGHLEGQGGSLGPHDRVLVGTGQKKSANVVREVAFYRMSIPDRLGHHRLEYSALLSYSNQLIGTDLYSENMVTLHLDVTSSLKTLYLKSCLKI